MFASITEAVLRLELMWKTRAGIQNVKEEMTIKLEFWKNKVPCEAPKAFYGKEIVSGNS